MSEKGEKTCPICAEEMDLTDQQLKPCKCGYEVCVWCWHYIMEMAEMDGKEGRCLVCRTPYDKEKIVGVVLNCENLVAETNLKRKQKKPKGPDAKKHLTDVRVLLRGDGARDDGASLGPGEHGMCMLRSRGWGRRVRGVQGARTPAVSEEWRRKGVRDGGGRGWGGGAGFWRCRCSRRWRKTRGRG